MVPKELKLSLLLTLLLFVVFSLVLFGVRNTSSGQVGRVLDEQGQPVAGAYVIYGYNGQHFIHGEVDRPGTIIQTDRNGFFRIPSKKQKKLPLFSSKLYLEFYAVYDPITHCVGLLPNKKSSRWRGWERFAKDHW